MKNTARPKIDLNRVKKVELTPTAKMERLQKDKTKSPKKKLKKDRSKLQVKKDRPTSRYWMRKADAEWGKVMHHLKRYCLICGRSDRQLQAHHLIGRARVMTRHDIDNGVILCNIHHNRDVTCSPHAGPIGFTEFLRENHPDKLEYVIKNQHLTGKPDYRAKYEHLTELIDEN